LGRRRGSSGRGRGGSGWNVRTRLTCTGRGGVWRGRIGRLSGVGGIGRGGGKWRGKGRASRQGRQERDGSYKSGKARASRSVGAAAGMQCAIAQPVRPHERLIATMQRLSQGRMHGKGNAQRPLPFRGWANTAGAGIRGVLRGPTVCYCGGMSTPTNELRALRRR
jgi:hypothetical protein